uniref:Uncharacterized protein n=1 Tax=Arundo donax TaxID=35708 RepID=A0A0A8ZLZ6_ARUDO
MSASCGVLRALPRAAETPSSALG